MVSWHKHFCHAVALHAAVLVFFPISVVKMWRLFGSSYECSSLQISSCSEHEKEVFWFSGKKLLLDVVRLYIYVSVGVRLCVLISVGILSDRYLVKLVSVHF